MKNNVNIGFGYFLFEESYSLDTNDYCFPNETYISTYHFIKGTLEHYSIHVGFFINEVIYEEEKKIKSNYILFVKLTLQSKNSLL